MLLAMPRADGLFRRAILQSGAAHQVTPAADALRIAGYLAGKLGVAVDAGGDRRRAGVERLLAVQTELKGELIADPDPDRWGTAVVASGMPWQPVIDGDVLPGVPIERIAAGSGGAGGRGRRHEHRRLAAVAGRQRRDRRDHRRDPHRAGPHLRVPVPGRVRADGRGRRCTAYRAEIPGGRPRRSAGGGPDRLVDADPRDPPRRSARRANAGSGTYMYEFAWASPGLGAVHALEIPFVFDTATTDAPLFGPMLGEDPPQELARTMHAAWVAFAAHRRPGLAAVRPGATGHDAVRHGLPGGGGSEVLGTGPVDRHPLGTLRCYISSSHWINGGWAGPDSRSHEGCPCRPLSTPCWCCSWWRVPSCWASGWGRARERRRTSDANSQAFAAGFRAGPPPGLAGRPGRP